MPCTCDSAGARQPKRDNYIDMKKQYIQPNIDVEAVAEVYAICEGTVTLGSGGDGKSDPIPAPPGSGGGAPYRF